MEQRCQVVLFSSAGKKCFGPGPAELLERVERSGSLHQAAKQMYLSYSKAFKLREHPHPGGPAGAGPVPRLRGRRPCRRRGALPPLFPREPQPCRRFPAVLIRRGRPPQGRYRRAPLRAGGRAEQACGAAQG